MLSQYFEFNTLSTDIQTLENLSKTKNIHTRELNIGDRTVCMMMRNVNILTKYKYESQIIQIIFYLHNSVLQLRKYKDNFDKNWWNNKKDIQFQRSTFNEYYKDLSKGILDNATHVIFKSYKDLYTKVEDENIRNFILESVYYTYKINLQLLEYENISHPLTEAGKHYTQQWTSILNTIKNTSIINYDPYLFTVSKFENLTKRSYIKMGTIVPINNQKELIEAFDFSREYVNKIITEGSYDTIIELGSGWGCNMFYYLSKIKNLTADIFMGEYTSVGIEASKYIKDRFFPQQNNVNMLYFDYNNPNLFFEKIKYKKKPKNVLITTFWSIEQITNIKPEVIDNILALGDNVTCINLEPIGWQVNAQSIMKENTVGHRNYYNKNFFSLLKSYECKNKLFIKNIKLDYFNFGDPQSCGTLIEWKKI